MPITEAEMTQVDMEKAVQSGHLCAECGHILTVAWGGSIGIDSFILRCGNDIKHSGITRHDKKEEQKRREYFSMESTALMAMNPDQMLARVNMGKFPQDLTLPEKKVLAEIAITYGFDPLMGEITIYEGRPYVTIDGRYRKAQETGKLDGVETRPATKQERVDWEIPEGDYFFRSEVYVNSASRPFVGWGRVRASETKPGSRRQGDTTSTYKPIQNNPQRMAEKRAEAQGLRKAFHIPLPSAEDIGSPDEVPYDIEGEVVNTKTGEITSPKVTQEEVAELAEQGKDKLEKEEAPLPEPTKSKSSPPAEESNSNLPEEQPEAEVEGIDTDIVNEYLVKISWHKGNYVTAKSWLRAQFKVAEQDNLWDMVAGLKKEQQEQFINYVQSLAELA